MKTENIRIVLIETSHPGNIGAAARAMKNMCLNELVLVKPKDYPSGQATARASGADDVLYKARVVESLDDALVGCKLVVGTSARHRRISYPVDNPRECGARVASASDDGQVAIIFGREHSGLTNDELDRCHYLVHIPTNPDYSSLNLAAAVQIISYEIMTAGEHGVMPQRAESSDDEPATTDEIEGYYRHMEAVLVDIGFLQPPYQKLMRRLRRLYSRAQLTKTELHILRGIMSAAQGKKYLWMKQLGLISDSSEPTKKDTD